MTATLKGGVAENRDVGVGDVESICGEGFVRDWVSKNVVWGWGRVPRGERLTR
jgi:hypothetical protein